MSIKIGFLPLYIKLYDDTNPHYRDPMVQYMKTAIAMLETQGIEVVEADVCRIEPEFRAAAEKFNEADVDAVVTMHLAYSPSLESIGALVSLKAPIVILDTTLGYDLMERMEFENGISPNHGIHGVQDMCNLLRRNDRDYHICAGHLLHSDVIARVARCCRAAAVAKAYRGARVGTVGGSFKGMGDFYISPAEYKEKIGADVFEMSRADAEKYLSEVQEHEIDAELAFDRTRFTLEDPAKDNYRAATKAGLAVRKWMRDQALTAVTVNFMNLDESGLPKMPFVEMCKVMMRGQGYAGEGDVLTAGLVGALRSIYPNTTFTEMFCPDWKNDVVLLSHMGEMNLNLATTWHPVLANCTFRYNSTGDTVAAYGSLKAGRAVLVNLAPMKEGFSLILSPVEMLDAGREFGAYRHEMQGWMKPGMPLEQFLTRYSELGGTHHSALLYDVPAEELAAFGRMMGFDVTVIGQ